ncbi:hypothetical protein ACFEY4_002012 [Enterobacter asburiae]
MVQKWFYSWVCYTSNEAGGSTVFKAGSDIAEFSQHAAPEDVFLELRRVITDMNNGSLVHITALNKV